MGYVVIDLEFNNLSNITKYYPHFFNENAELKNINFDNEIIEIGAVKLDKNINEVEKLKIFIKPTIFKKMNPKITEITHITGEMLSNGVSFVEGMDKLRDFIDDDDVLCSWAKDDVAELIKNAKYHDYEIMSWLRDYIDIQEYATKVLAKKKSLSLKNAVELLRINVEGNKLHDALYDSICTAKVFKRLFNGRIIKNYIYREIYNTPVFTAQDLGKHKIQKEMINIKCPHCLNNLILEEDFKFFGWRFIGLYDCHKCKSKILKEVVVKQTLNGQEIYNEIDTILDDIQYLNYAYKFEKISKNDRI